MATFTIAVDKIGQHYYGNWTQDGTPVRIDANGAPRPCDPIHGERIFETAPVEAETLDAATQHTLKEAATREARRRKIAEDVTP